MLNEELKPIDEKNYAERVRTLFFDCLFRNQEEAEPFIEEKTYVPSKGIVRSVAFHPERLESHREEILGLMNEIVSDIFFIESGGGMSFIRLSFDKDEELWAEHQNAEQLFQLAQAIGHAGKNTENPAIISVFPGGIPYVWFSKEKKDSNANR